MIKEIPRDHAAPGAWASLARPRTALTVTMHHLSQRHCAQDELLFVTKPKQGQEPVRKRSGNAAGEPT